MDEPPPPLVPLASDKLGGHFIAGVGAAVQAPFGDLRKSENAANLGAGFGAALDLGFGVSRSVVLGAWGNFFSFGAGEQSFSVGPFVSYHMVQGMRFDPWVLAGAGYRMQTRDAAFDKRQFAGVEFLHLAIGGDYYAWSGLGFGPWIEFDSGVFTSRPDTNSVGQPDVGSVGSAVHFAFLGGLRIVLDVPGK